MTGEAGSALGWHLNNPAQVAVPENAKCSLRRGVPETASPNGAMKAATRVPTRDPPASLYPLPDVPRVSPVHAHMDAFKLTDNCRIY